MLLTAHISERMAGKLALPGLIICPTLTELPKRYNSALKSPVNSAVMNFLVERAMSEKRKTGPRYRETVRLINRASFKELRKRLGMSQIVLAERAGVYTSAIQRLEQGKHVERKSAGPIAEVLGESVQGLFISSSGAVIPIMDGSLRPSSEPQNPDNATIAAKLSATTEKERGLYPKNQQSYELYQKARRQWDARNPMTIKDCILSFEMAAQRDPEYALPLLGLAEGYIMAVAHGLMPSEVALPKSKAAAQQALAINPQLGQPFASLAFNSVSFDKDWHNAELLVERALALNPNYAFTHNALAYVSITRGDLDRAIAALDTAITLAPFSLPMRILQGDAYYLAGETKKSVEVLARICQESPDSVLAHVCLGLASTQAGDYKKAIAAHEIAVKLGRGNPQYIGFLGFAYAASGKIKKAKEKMDQLQQRFKRGYVPQYSFALLNIGIGEYDKALAHLEQGYTTHDHWLSFALVDPKLDPLRNSERFKRLVSRFKLSG